MPKIDPQRIIRQFYGDQTRRSDWLTVDQETIDTFAKATRDFDWIHVDPERAKRDGPFGGTIAFGFWTLSMLTYFLRQMMGRPYPDGALFGLNYGFNRIRLTAPIRVGKRIRATCRLRQIEPRGQERYLASMDFRIEVEGEQKPALVCEWLVLFVYPSGTDAAR